MTHGASVLDGKVGFRVWAPAPKEMKLRLWRANQAPQDAQPETDPRDSPQQEAQHKITLQDAPQQDAQHKTSSQDFPMNRLGEDFVVSARAAAGDRYAYILDGSQPIPDPVSRSLPEGVHGPTEIVDPLAFRWTDESWRGLPLSEYVIYELHVGTFTPEGTFDGVIGRLPYLKDLGVTVIEIMPVAACPGARNWGYDGVSPYAVQASYGGPAGLKRLVDAAHALGMGVMLDVVYNHLGPEGNYLPKFGPYFTAKHQTPWGEAVNYDSDGCEGVRSFVIKNALYWIREYHLDGLRLDAVQTIKDGSPQHILAEIQESVQELAGVMNREVYVIAETDENDSRYVKPAADGGYGLDGVWSDDFHHAVHAYFTGERQGYYQDFGDPAQIASALRDGYVFQGETFRFWSRPRGTSAAGVPLPSNIICTQNHDQVGNRAKGERLTVLMPRGACKLAAALLLLAPHTPLLFMGQEYDESAPFQFFADFQNAALKKAVSEGRRSEFKDFDFNEVPDPEDPATFERSKLRWADGAQNREMLEWYRRLLQLRKEHVSGGKRTADAQFEHGVLRMQVPAHDPKVLVLAALEPGKNLPPVKDEWHEALRSAEDGYEVSVFVR
jgi:maltooligosyltrehalose trehalohydrolase